MSLSQTLTVLSFFVWRIRVVVELQLFRFALAIQATIGNEVSERRVCRRRRQGQPLCGNAMPWSQRRGQQ
jgi:hypothetical protein